MKATEDKVHSFIIEVNDMIDNHAELFTEDQRFSEIFQEFWSSKEQRESQNNYYTKKTDHSNIVDTDNNNKNAKKNIVRKKS